MAVAPTKMVGGFDVSGFTTAVAVAPGVSGGTQVVSGVAVAVPSQEEAVLLPGAGGAVAPGVSGGTQLVTGAAAEPRPIIDPAGGTFVQVDPATQPRVAAIIQGASTGGGQLFEGVLVEQGLTGPQAIIPEADGIIPAADAAVTPTAPAAGGGFAVAAIVVVIALVVLS